MIPALRRRRADRHARKRQHTPDGEPETMEIAIPDHFRCPISLDLMKDPVTLSTGITYDRESIDAWIEAGNYMCPVTNQVLRTVEPVPNHAIRKMIQDWCVENRSYGIERIPTPRVPVSAIELSEVLSGIKVATQEGDQKKCKESVAKIKNWGKESERNKRCVVANGTGCALSAAFDQFASSSVEKNSAVLEEILSAITWMFPLDAEAQARLASRASLGCLVWFANSGDLSRRRNAVWVLKELLSMDQKHADSLADIEGANEVLIKLIKEPICPTATKASLLVIFHLVSSASASSEKIKSRFVQMGLVSLLMEILVDSEKSTSEKALGVLDRICSSHEGREEAYGHALTMPILVKKILRVSDLATDFSVSIVLKLCKNEKREDGGVLVEALQVGAFQKLLLLLQVGCGERTKERTTELLKLLNHYRDSLECIDSMDFKNLKRPS